MPSPDHQQLLSTLDVQRKSLELEAEAIQSELTSLKVGLKAPLVDSEGYPLANIDLFRVRELRNRHSMIQTDHKEKMKQLQQLLLMNSKSASSQNDDELEKRRAVKPKPKFDAKTGKWVVQNWDGSIAGVAGGDTRRFDALEEDETDSSKDAVAAAAAATTAAVTETATAFQEKLHLREESLAQLPGFALIESVAPESPASLAGLRSGDILLQFGPTITTFDTAALSQLVPQAASEKQSLVLGVRRPSSSSSSGSGEEEEIKILHIQPKPWAGRGLLGCHMVPKK